MGYFGIPFRNGVPIGLGSVASFGAQQFDPSSLFIGGTAGTWHDPSDPTTLFTTSTGTTPCAVPGSGSQVLVGLMLDKSQGAPGALGAELITPTANRDFSSNTGYWTPQDGSITISGGAANFSSTTNTFALYAAVSAISASLGKYYEITYTLVSCSAGAIRFGIGANYATSRSAPGTYTERITAGAGGFFGFYAVGITTASVDNISVREIPGNHAIAFNDTTARPELSARVNLLTYSEEFENAVWLSNAATVTPNTVLAPNNTLTADSVNFTDTIPPAAAVRIYQDSSTLSVNGVSYVGSIWMRADSDRTVVLTIQRAGPADTQSVTCNVTTSWQRFSLTHSGVWTGSSAVRLNVNNPSQTGVIYAWGADLRPANIGSAIPAYQRIADQYTYDSNGFPSYLRFDGVDDSMYTPASINFSGTDKMSVFAGVRKLSDAATSVIAELSADKNSNNGVFLLNTEAAPRWYWESKGTLIAATNSGAVTTFAAPITSVVTGIGNIGGDSSILRVNSSQLGSTASDQGTGNYGTYPLYIGSRNNSGLRFNGYLYSLITAGTQLQSGSITATEQYVAGKTGVQI